MTIPSTAEEQKRHLRLGVYVSPWMYQTAHMADQGQLLDEVAALVNAGKLRTTLGETLPPINAAKLRQAHRQIESGWAIGKLVLEGWR